MSNVNSKKSKKGVQSLDLWENENKVAILYSVFFLTKTEILYYILHNLIHRMS